MNVQVDSNAAAGTPPQLSVDAVLELPSAAARTIETSCCAFDCKGAKVDECVRENQAGRAGFG